MTNLEDWITNTIAKNNKYSLENWITNAIGKNNQYILIFVGVMAAFCIAVMDIWYVSGYSYHGDPAAPDWICLIVGVFGLTICAVIMGFIKGFLVGQSEMLNDLQDQINNNKPVSSEPQNKKEKLI